MQQEANKGNWKRSDSIQFFVLFSPFFALRFKMSAFFLSVGGVGESVTTFKCKNSDPVAIKSCIFN